MIYQGQGVHMILDPGEGGVAKQRTKSSQACTELDKLDKIRRRHKKDYFDINFVSDPRPWVRPGQERVSKQHTNA